MHLTQFWDRRPFPPDVTELAESHRNLNPDLEYRLMDREEAEQFIAGHFSSREVAAFRACAVPAMQADYFRYCAVLAEGGFYVDADTRGLAPLAPLVPAQSEGVMFERENGVVINGCFGFREAGHALMKVVLEIATVGIEKQLFERVWLATGPGIFTGLSVLSRSTPAERAELGLDSHDADDPTRSYRLCRDVVLAHGLDLDRLFDNVARKPIDTLYECVAEVDLAYKSTARHWVNWQGSIYRAPDCTQRPA